MKEQIWKRKYDYYKAWFFSLSEKEQCEFIGQWVLMRCDVFCTLLDESMDAKLRRLGVGTYKFSES